MNYRIDELICKPEYYDFDQENRKEWFRSGFFEYNITKLLSAARSGSLDPYLRTVSVEDCLSSIKKALLPTTFLEEADLSRPLLIAEISPFSYIIIDGYHRLAKAAAKGPETLQAYCLPAAAAVHFLSTEEQYLQYTTYWNGKVFDYERIPEYRGRFCPVVPKAKSRMLQADRLWNRLEKCMAECPRIELVCDAAKGLWFSVFRLNGKLYCGEADAHHSAACAAPFRLLPKHISTALPHFPEWLACMMEGKKYSLPGLKHADMILSVIRYFSQQETADIRPAEKGKK